MKKTMPKNLVEMLDASVNSSPDKVALLFADKKMSYQQLGADSDCFAQGLKNLGVIIGDKVGIFLQNSPVFVVAYFGALKLDATVVPLNHMLKPQETEFIMRNADVRVVVTSLAFLDTLRAVKENLPGLKHIILIDGVTADTLNFYNIIERTTMKFEKQEIDSGSIASILYTSGTTGRPKGAMLTHDNFISNCFACTKAVDLQKKDNVICLLPMFHSFAWTVCVLMPFTKSASVTIIDSLRPFRKVVRNVVKKKVTIFVAIPSVYHILAHISIPATFISRILKMIRSLRVCISGAAALPSEVLEAFEAKFRVPLLEGYGLTETSPVVSLNPLRGIKKVNSIGLPVSGVKVKVVNDKDEQLPSGEIGELIVKGRNVMRGYFKNKEETSKTLKNGWLYTGDLSKTDEDGYLYIVDRKKDMINVRGLNVYPAEIERVLLKNVKIEEAAVVGVPDKYKGEVPKAFIVVRKDVSLPRQELIRYLRKNLAAYKIPKYIEFRQVLPKTATGKIAKRQIT